jgi:serine/threonine protein kinase
VIYLRESVIPPMLGSRYRIGDRIGAGGMGEVYRAHDTVLDRQVALKVLPLEVAGDPERLPGVPRGGGGTGALDTRVGWARCIGRTTPSSTARWR